MHKWWAKRLGSIFRGILLGSSIGDKADLRKSFYDKHAFARIAVFDPFRRSASRNLPACGVKIA
jgi:putative DNA methylase